MHQPENSPRKENILLDWEIGYHEKEESQPKKWLPATVPGAVQLDVMYAENYRQPYWYGDNVQQFDWMENWYFTYKTNFPQLELTQGQKLYFYSKGIDYHFKVLLNGETLLEQEGMFTYVDLDLTHLLQAQNELKVVIRPIPKVKGLPEYAPSLETYRHHARESAKPAVSYGWDWHPRLVTRGIWDDTFLQIRNRSAVTDASVTYVLSDDFSEAKLTLLLKGEELKGSSFQWILKDKAGNIVFDKTGVCSGDSESLQAKVDQPELWWPAGYGDPVLYQSEVVLYNQNQQELDKIQSSVGFRRVRLMMNEGEWERPIGFPATRNYAPASLEINGKRIFAKGTNWVHPEIFVGLLTREIYEKQIQLALEANFNILRVWGGGIVNKEAFFDLCDEKGLLVWQEFPLACNNYTDDARYLAVLEQEATSIVNRLKTRACLAIWSGGNELFNAWGGMTDQSLALRLLNSICYRLDPNTPFIPTSPLNGMGHGSYLFFDHLRGENGQEVYQWMAEAQNTAYTEFGVPGVANLEVLKQFIPEDELFPPQRGTSWELHHGFGVWRKESWLEMPTLEKYFGEITSLEDLVRFSQLLQSEGYKFIYEEARRQKPYCSMALNWCYQEPWPAAANNSLISWPNVLKPAYFEVAAACRLVLASIRAPKFLWHEGEEFSCELFLLNDAYQTQAPVNIKVTLIYDGGKMLELISWNCQGTGEFENSKGPAARVALPPMENSFFSVRVEAAGKPELNSKYIFMYQAKRETGVKSGAEF